MRRSISSPAPFRPSSLRTSISPPASPVSALPLTPPASRPSSPPQLTIKRPDTPPNAPPGRPLPWLWTCHLCHSTYSLGVTRRCVHDGHYFCSGTTVRKDGSTKRHASCNSEFDYVGWSAWQDWRRETLNKEVEEEDKEKDCWHHCDYPSECRWGTRIGVKSKKPKKTVTQEKKAEFWHAPKLEDLRSETKDAIVEQVVSVMQKKSKSSLSPIKEDDEMLSPTSPLKQHYSLPELEAIQEEVDHSWALGDDACNDAAPDAGAISIMLDDYADAASQDERIPFEQLDIPEMAEFLDDESDTSSDSGVSPLEETLQPQGLGFLDVKTARSVIRSLEVKSLKSRRAGARKESYDSGYGSDENYMDHEALSSEEEDEVDQYLDIEMRT